MERLQKGHVCECEALIENDSPGCKGGSKSVRSNNHLVGTDIENNIKSFESDHHMVVINVQEAESDSQMEVTPCTADTDAVE